MRDFQMWTVLALVAGLLSSCHSGRDTATSLGDVCLHGVITNEGVPVEGFRIKTDEGSVAEVRDGYYAIPEAPAGDVTIHIRNTHGSKPRFYPRTGLSAPDEIRHYDLTPYYAADHGPFDYDWRLHRSWGNALDDPFDTASLNAFMENTHTASGIVLKPVYGSAVVLEAIWTIPGGIIGLGAAAIPKAFGKPFDTPTISKSLLAGYLPTEVLAKAIEVPVKTLFWPVDRLVSRSARKELNETRETILETNKQDDAPTDLAM